MTKPGHTELQQTPDGAHASDCDRVSAASPPFDAPYPPLSPNAFSACCDVTLMIRPQPRSAMPGPKRCPSRNGAVRFTAIVTSQSASDSDASGGRRLTPAQFTRMSGSPNNPAASSAIDRTDSRTARSPCTQLTVHPSADMRPAVLASVAAVRATSTTRAPARPSAPAIAAPMPELPPVTTATLPSSENSELK